MTTTHDEPTMTETIPTATAIEEIEFPEDEAAQGREYVFARVAATVAAHQVPDNAWGFDRPCTRNGVAWLPGAPKLTPDLPVLVRAERRIDGMPVPGAAVTYSWSDPVIVGRYCPIPTTATIEQIDETFYWAADAGAPYSDAFRAAWEPCRQWVPGHAVRAITPAEHAAILGDEYADELQALGDDMGIVS
ncbi:MAG: hypothetical protein OXH70_17715 [Acidobacteria bacterium]|nr:hypothetical protein [Acidobacteriota bacterium]